MEERIQPSRGHDDNGLFATHRAYEASQASRQAERRDLSAMFRHESNRNAKDTQHVMHLHSLSSQATLSTDQDSHNIPQDKHELTENPLLEQRCHNQRKELNTLGGKLQITRAMLREERNEHKRQMELKDEELRRCSVDNCKLRESVASFTKQKLILQPQQDLKDTDIALKYQNLCTAIADWEEMQFEEMDNPLEGLEYIAFRPAVRELIEAYLIAHGEAKIAVTHPTTGNIMMTCLIHCLLHDTVLKETICWPSLDPYIEKFVSFVKHGMKTMKPARDELLVGIWGSEIQRVFSQSPAMLGQRNEYLEEQCRTLAKVLVEFLPDDQKANFRFAGLVTIFKDAADLAHQIQLSPQSYGYETAFRYSDPNSTWVLFNNERTEYKIINAANSQPIRDSDIIEAGPNGRIGKKLCVIHPALVRRGQGERGDIVLTKATILASLDKPISRPQRAKTQPNIEVKIEPREQERTSWRDWFGNGKA